MRPERSDLRPERSDGGDEQTNDQMDERKSPCILQDFVPFGATALLPLNLDHTLLKQGTGTTDHLLLGNGIKEDQKLSNILKF